MPHIRHPASSAPSTPLRQRGAAWVMPLLVWLTVLGGLFWWFQQHEAQQASAQTAYMAGADELVIPRGRNGHFFVDGEINGEQVHFLVDTGASDTAITQELADLAGLRGGIATQFSTANGIRQGYIYRNVTVSAGGLVQPGMLVGSGLVNGHGDMRHGLLGQSFLSHFDISIGQDSMTLRRRATASTTQPSSQP